MADQESRGSYWNTYVRYPLLLKNSFTSQASCISFVENPKQPQIVLAICELFGNYMFSS